MNFAWMDGSITRIDKFNEHSVWSFAMLLCAVLLGLERCYAIISRARMEKRKREIAHAEMRKIHENGIALSHYQS